MSFLSIDHELARDSYYAATASRTRHHPPLQEALDVDVAVVGGGLAGLSAALELALKGYQVAVLERDELVSGASGRNGGQALVGLACDHSVIEHQLGAAAARQVWDMTVESVQLIRTRCQTHAIDCDWQSGYLSLAVNAKKASALRQWQADMAQRYQYTTQWIEPQDLGSWIDSPRFHSGLYDPLSGHLHPLKYGLGLARACADLGVKLFEHSPVTALTGGSPSVLRTPQGQVRARQVLLAGNVTLKGIAPVLEPRIMPVGTYIVTSETLPDSLAQSLLPSRAAVCDTNFVLDYFRPTPDHHLLYGGRVSYSTATPKDLVASMQARMTRTFPQLQGVKVSHAWGGFVDITLNRAPDFGRLSDRLPADQQRAHAHIYYLQGFSGHGLALTGLAGQIVAQAMDGQASRLDVFRALRHRAFPGGTLLRTPALVAAMAWFRLRDLL